MSSHIEYRKFPRGEHCDDGRCGSRRYFIEDGKQYCRNGHQQQGFFQVQADEDDFNSQGRKTRLKKSRVERVELVFSGQEATKLFLQAYQLVLWKQVAWLVGVKGMPAELETIVRDLWAVRLRAVKGLGEEAESGKGESGGFNSGSGPYEGLSSTEEMNFDGSEVMMGLEMEKRRKKAARHNGLPKLVDSLALCYLGMMLLRLPVSLGQIQRWVERDEIVYLRAVSQGFTSTLSTQMVDPDGWSAEVSQIREVPKDMRAHLPAYYHSALDARAELEKGALHKAVLELVVFFKKRFDIIFPPLNAPLILFKHVRDLGLPVDIYAAVKRMAKILEFEFSFPNTLNRHKAISYPENQIISLIVIATKLSRPFDDIIRTPESAKDPTALGIDWEVWLDAMREPPSEGIRRGGEIKISDKDVLNMDDKKLDEYLDWYQRTWIDDRDVKMPDQVLDFFPLEQIPSREEVDAGESDDDLVTERAKTIQANLVWQKPLSSAKGQNDPTINRPGSFYRYYRHVDDLPEKAMGFYMKAAENAGLSLDMLCRSVYMTERRLQRWIMTERGRRQEEGMQQMNDDEEMKGT